MTTETSNARGEVVAWIRVKPDGSPDWAEDCIADDEHFLNPAMEADGYRLRPLIYADAAPPPAAARGDVRGLVAKLAAHVRPTCSELWDEAQAFLAAEGVQAGEVEQRAPDVAMALHWIDRYAAGVDDACQIDLVAEALGVTLPDGYALSQQPEARGVVDEGSRIVTSQLLHWGGIPVYVTGTVTTSPGNWPLIDAALTEARNVR